LQTRRSAGGHYFCVCCIAVHCSAGSVFQRIAARCTLGLHVCLWVAVYCSELQAVCCSVLQCVADLESTYIWRGFYFTLMRNPWNPLCTVTRPHVRHASFFFNAAIESQCIVKWKKSSRKTIEFCLEVLQMSNVTDMDASHMWMRYVTCMNESVVCHTSDSNGVSHIW